MKLKWLCAAASLLAATPASAGMAPGGWFMGDWRCTLDGRPTRMSWRVVSVDHGSNHGDHGTSVASAETRGRFEDRGAWANLTFQRTTPTTLHFRHQDGNNWFLRRSASAANQATGFSTWNGRRYPLSCTRSR